LEEQKTEGKKSKRAERQKNRRVEEQKSRRAEEQKSRTFYLLTFSLSSLLLPIVSLW
jgi:hypothetical protein